MSHSSSRSSSLVMRRPRLPAFERAVLDRVGAHRRDVEAGRVVDSAGDVRYRDDGRAAVDELLRGDPADVPEPLDDAPLLGELPAQALARARYDHHDTGSRRLVAEDGASDRDRLARDDLRHRVAALHRVRVHHPRHRLLVRRHVRRRNVLLRADERQQLGREAPREALELDARQLPRVAPNAALRATVRQSQQRALPGHPHSQRGALAERDLRVVADAALRRAHHARVLHAVAGEDDARAVVELHRARDDDRALRVPEALGDTGVHIRVRHGLVELRDRRAVERRVVFEVGERRDVLGARHGALSVSPTRCADFSRTPERCRGWESNPDVPNGTAGFKPAASDQFRHPGGCRGGYRR